MQDIDIISENLSHIHRHMHVKYFQGRIKIFRKNVLGYRTIFFREGQKNFILGQNFSENFCPR